MVRVFFYPYKEQWIAKIDNNKIAIRPQYRAP